MGSVEAWFAPGARWSVHMADFDVADNYWLDLQPAADGLRVQWGFAPEDDEEGERDDGPMEGSAHFSGEALERGDGVLFLSQGSGAARDDDAGQPYLRQTPPFLVSRATREALLAGKPARFTIYGEDVSLERQGTETRTLRVDGVERSVEALRASGGDITVWILDHPQWAVLLRAEFQGGNEVRTDSDR
jgi:hypothetical protein